MVACDSTNSVNWELSSSHIYDETPKPATALGWICLDNFLTGTSQRLLINERRKKKKEQNQNQVFLELLVLWATHFFFFFLGIAHLAALQTSSTSRTPSEGTRQKHSFLPSPGLRKRAQCTCLRTNKCNVHSVTPHNEAVQLYTK